MISGSTNSRRLFARTPRNCRVSGPKPARSPSAASALPCSSRDSDRAADQPPQIRAVIEQGAQVAEVRGDRVERIAVLAPARTRPRHSVPASPTRWLKMQAIRRFPGDHEPDTCCGDGRNEAFPAKRGPNITGPRGSQDTSRMARAAPDSGPARAAAKHAVGSMSTCRHRQRGSAAGQSQGFTSAEVRSSKSLVSPRDAARSRAGWR